MASGEITRIFNGMAEDLAAFMRATNNADRTYMEAVKEAAEAAKAYKDEGGELAKRKASAQKAHADALYYADTTLTANMKQCHIPMLRAYLKKNLCAAPKAEFVSILNCYRQFGLTMSKTELDNLLELADGNFLALQALAAVAKDSGFALTVAAAKEFEADIAQLENRFTSRPVLWHDHEFHPVACETRETKSKAAHDESMKAAQAYGLEVWSGSTEASAELLLAKAAFDDLANSMDAMLHRWAVGFVPTVESYAAEALKATGKKEAADVIGKANHGADVAIAAAAVQIENTSAELLAKKVAQDHRRSNEESAKSVEAFI